MSTRGVRTSVIVPCYQGEAFLAEAVQSVHAQGEDDLEIVVVDDGSTDGSAEVARSLHGVRLVQQANGGIAAARNAGVSVARGEWLAFLDCDDLWTPDALALRRALLHAQPAAHMAFGGVEMFAEDGAGGRPLARPDVERGLLAGSLLLRRADFLRVGPFDIRYRAGEFLDWYARAEEAGLQAVHTRRTVLRRRVHANNTVRDLDLISRAYAQVLHARLKRLRGGGREPV